MAIPIEWLMLIGAVVVIFYIAYSKGHRDGKRRALRDNRDDDKADFKSRIVGKWSEFEKSNAATGLLTTEFFDNGVTTTSGQLKLADKESIHDVKVEGTWLIDDVHLIMTITKSNFPALVPIGKTFKDEILQITDTRVKYINQRGRIKTHVRA